MLDIARFISVGRVSTLITPPLLEPRHKLPSLRIPRNFTHTSLIIKMNIQHHPARTFRVLQLRRFAQCVLGLRPPQAEVPMVVRVLAFQNKESNGVHFGRSYR